MADPDAASDGEKGMPSPWTPTVIALLRDWAERAGRSSETHFSVSSRLVSVLAAVLASLQTFLRFGERAEKHRAAAESWAAVRREIDEMVALHPTYLASRGDPKQYLDDLRRRMGEIAQQSPEMGEQGWWAAGRRYRHEEALRADLPVPEVTAP